MVRVVEDLVLADQPEQHEPGRDGGPPLDCRSYFAVDP